MGGFREESVTFDPGVVASVRRTRLWVIRRRRRYFVRMSRLSLPPLGRCVAEVAHSSGRGANAPATHLPQLQRVRFRTRGPRLMRPAKAGTHKGLDGGLGEFDFGDECNDHVNSSDAMRRSSAD